MNELLPELMLTHLLPDRFPHPADVIIADYVHRISAIRPGFIKGVYITGSLPLHDFYPNKSDIDFIVLCSELPDRTLSQQLKRIHTLLSREFPKPDLSGHYLAIGSLQIDPSQFIDTLSYHEGKMRYGKFEMAPVSLYEMKSQAWTMYGIAADQLEVDISLGLLHRFMFENINTYWKKWLDKHSPFTKRKLLLLTFPRFTEWSVLGIARQLCTLHTDRIVSKTEAGYFCLKLLPEQISFNCS